MDSGDAGRVFDYLRGESLQLSTILNIHHKADHVGGNADLLSKYNVPVFGPAQENIPGVARKLTEGDEPRTSALEPEFHLALPGCVR